MIGRKNQLRLQVLRHAGSKQRDGERDSVLNRSQKRVRMPVPLSASGFNPEAAYETAHYAIRGLSIRKIEQSQIHGPRRVGAPKYTQQMLTPKGERDGSTVTDLYFPFTVGLFVQTENQ